MYLSNLKLTHFKNYETRSFAFSPRLNCLTGLNGAGKTNVLDAVYYLCLCKSHSGINDRHIPLHGSTFFRLEGHFEREGKRAKIVAKYQSGARKEMEHNDVPYEKLADHIGQIPVVMIAPDDVALVQEGSEDRRRFMDAGLSQTSSEYLYNLLIYNALLKQRNALLKWFAEQRQFDQALLESIDRQMTAPAAVVHAARQAFVGQISPLFQEYYAAISGSRETVDMRLDADLEGNNLPALLADNVERDRHLQRTAAGPHRDDLLLFMDGQAVKKFASQGQTKSFLLAMRLAQYEVLRQQKGVSPILLLDDIFDKLDMQRVAQLMGLLIERNFGQIFITDTQKERVERVIGGFAGEHTLFEL